MRRRWVSPSRSRPGARPTCPVRTRRTLASHPQLAREAVVDAAAPLLAAPLGRCGDQGAARVPRRVRPRAGSSRAGTSRSPASCSTRPRTRGTWRRSPRSISARGLRTWEELAGRGAKAVPSTDLPIETTATWAGEVASAVADLAPLLHERLARDGIDALFRDVEMPLTAVLARMERAGVRVDEAALRALSREYERAPGAHRDGDPRTGRGRRSRSRRRSSSRRCSSRS